MTIRQKTSKTRIKQLSQTLLHSNRDLINFYCEFWQNKWFDWVIVSDFKSIPQCERKLLSLHRCLLNWNLIDSPFVRLIDHSFKPISISEINATDWPTLGLFVGHLCESSLNQFILVFVNNIMNSSHVLRRSAVPSRALLMVNELDFICGLF